MKRITFHPLLISIFPALTLLAHNIGEIKPSMALRSLVVSFLGAAVLFFLLRLLIRDWKRSAFLTTILLVWFSSYGQIYNALKHTQIVGILVGRHVVLVPIWLLTLALALWWTHQKIKDTATLTLALNSIAVALLVLPLAQITLFEIRTQAAWSNTPKTSTGEISIPNGSIPPDIYYIILDAYSREDILQAEFGYDNASFIHDLTQMGFYVASCSQSNYGQTELSLASSLNFNYLQTLGDQFVGSSTSIEHLLPLVKHSAVRQMLEGLGYTTVAFETGYLKTELEDADYYLTPPRQGSLKSLFSTSGLNSFEVMYLHSTAGLLLTDFAQKLHLPQKFVPDVSYPKRKDRERTLYVLGQLQFNHVPSLQSPKLVFAHLVIPHHPFVFGPNGEQVNLPDYDKNGYRDQAIYISQQITSIVKNIITYSDHPPVIVIQGDHGAPTGLIPETEHMAILNAYYLPGADPSSLYANISPVNTFRVIFNQYFGGSYPMLEDVAYFSPYQRPYVYKIIPDPQSGCVGK